MPPHKAVKDFLSSLLVAEVLLVDGLGLPGHTPLPPEPTSSGHGPKSQVSCSRPALLPSTPPASIPSFLPNRLPSGSVLGVVFPALLLVAQSQS